MKVTGQPSDSAAPVLTLTASDEEVLLRVSGFVVLRAAYEAEGYYDESAGGDPQEQDLYRVEVLDAPRAARAVEAMEGDSVGPLVDLGLTDALLWRLFPAARWAPDADPLALVERYLLILAHALSEEVRPVARQLLLESSANWSPEVVMDAFQSLPPEWRHVLSQPGV
jgi:hypothetical protein